MNDIALMAYSLATLAVCGVVTLGLHLWTRISAWRGRRRAARDGDLREKVEMWVEDAIRIAKRDGGFVEID